MNIAIKKSHGFSFAIAAGATFGFWVSQIAFAAIGAMAWADVPALMVLQFLVSGLLGISFDFVWQFVSHHKGRVEQPESAPAASRLFGVVCGVAVLTMTAAGAAPVFFW